MAPSSLLLRNSLRSGTELRRLRQRASCYSQDPQTLEGIPRRSTSPNRHSHRSYQSTIMERAEKNKPKGRKRVPRTIGVQLRTKAYSGDKERKSRRPIMKERLRYREQRQRRCSHPPGREIHQNSGRRANRRSGSTITSQCEQSSPHTNNPTMGELTSTPQRTRHLVEGLRVGCCRRQQA